MTNSQRRSRRSEVEGTASPEEALRIAKMLFLVIMIGQFAFLLFAAVVMTTDMDILGPTQIDFLPMGAAIIGALALVAGPIARKVVFGRASGNDSDSVLRSFVQGNLVCHVILEGGLIINVFAAILAREFIPNYIIALALFGLSFWHAPFRLPGTRSDR